MKTGFLTIATHKIIKIYEVTKICNKNYLDFAEVIY